MNKESVFKRYKKRQNLRELIYAFCVLLFGIVFCINLVFYFSRAENSDIILFSLIRKNYKVFLFLFLTGHFLSSFKHSIYGMSITFNAFLVYISNNILKSDVYQGQVLVYFFIFGYFLSLLIVHIIFNGLSLKIFEQLFVRILLWSVLVFAFNTFLANFSINIINLTVRDVLMIPVFVLIHIGIKSVFVISERLLQKKYYSFVQHTLPYIIMDSIFIYFAIIVGSVYLNFIQFSAIGGGIYKQIGLLNTAFFISFLAIAISLTIYIIQRESRNTLFYNIHSFFPPEVLYNKKIFPYLPVVRKHNLKTILHSSVTSLTFVVFSAHDFIKNFDTIISNKSVRLFVVDKKFICCILTTKSLEIPKRIKRRQFESHFLDKLEDYSDKSFILKKYTPKGDEYVLSEEIDPDEEEKIQFIFDAVSFNVSLLKSDLDQKYHTSFNAIYCKIDRKLWNNINIHYLYKILFFKLKSNRRRADIMKVNQTYIFS